MMEEERFRLLVESVTDYAIYMLDPEGHVVSWNLGAQRFKGYRDDEIVGKHFSRFYTDEDKAAGIPAHALLTATTTGKFEAEGWRMRKDGTRFWASVVIDPVRDPHGSLLGFAKVTRDLTERREAQQALEAAREAFFQSQKMDAIGKLTGGVAHDFNNLLAVVIGSLDLARRRLAEGGDVTRFIDNAMQAAERGATLTQRMLAFARRQELEFTTIDVAVLIAGMGDLIARTIGATVTIRTQIARSLPPVRADAGQLELAILNLVVNARDAMPDGGILTVGADIVQGPPAPLEAGSYARIFVDDTGSGMDADTLTRAMEPFFTTKGIGKGTGLGLSMVHGLAEQSGGALRLLTVPGVGTTAELWLPIAVDASEQSDAPEIVAQPSDGPSLTVLAVDDDRLVLNNTVAMLEELGHRAIEAPSAEHALMRLASEPVDVVLTDFAMPGMNGLELAERLAVERPGLPVILTSGFAELPPERAGAVFRLAKPFRPDALEVALQQVCRDLPNRAADA